MVVNLCLPHFNTTVHCNKLCADGYDVTNLVSADPAHRRQGFKLEYFLRPPVQVTLKFDFQVELCRVDVELWPWGMDRGQACKRLELSTCSDRTPSHNFDHSHKLVLQKEHIQMQVNDPNVQKREKQEHGSKSRHCDAHQWSVQTRQWGEETQTESQRMGQLFKCQSNTLYTNLEPEFKLVGRCELKEETRVCFKRSNFSPRPPFLSPPPPQPPDCWQEELWNRGLPSLGAVTQLRVTMPFGGAASALGLKALVVWGRPARCCTAEEVERIKRVHEASEKQRPVLFASSVNQTKPPLQAGTSPSNLSIPEEFLDAITQEVMTLPMLLPSGVSVDNTTLGEHQKREATWGRPPNDPFTGVPFTPASQPLPNPQLKRRIDHFLLQKGMMRRDGELGRRGDAGDPQASRLIASNVDGQTQNNVCLTERSTNQTVLQYSAGTRNTNQREDSGLGCSSENRIRTSNPLLFTTGGKSKLERKNKRDQGEESVEGLTVEKQLLLQTKRPRNAAASPPSCSSHEQRLSASLDEALISALQGRPSFTSNLSQQRQLTPDTEPLDTSQSCQTAGATSMPTGEKKCSSCFRSVSVYSTSPTSIYRLTCGHLLCRSCLKSDSQPLNSVTVSTPSRIVCPACQSPTPRSDIVRVHH